MQCPKSNVLAHYHPERQSEHGGCKERSPRQPSQFVPSSRLRWTLKMVFKCTPWAPVGMIATPAVAVADLVAHDNLGCQHGLVQDGLGGDDDTAISRRA